MLRLVIALATSALQAAPVITDVTNAPSAPTAMDPVWITAQVTGDVSIANVSLTYSAGAGGPSQPTNVFRETMRSSPAKPWTGDGCINPWTVTFAGTNCFEQRGPANHGTGNTNGAEFKGGTANLTDSMLAPTQPIDARGASGFVEFWTKADGLSGTAGWTFQLDSGSGYVTRLSELTGTSHAWQSNHYDLQPSELVSNLFMRFQFQGGQASNRIDLDDISLIVVRDGGSGSTNVAMLDDGLHHDGVAGDSIYGGQIPALPTGTTLQYYVAATDTGGQATTNPPGAPGNAFSYVVALPPNQPPVIANATNLPASPTDTDPVWVTARVTDDRSVTAVQLTYSTGGDLTNVTMYDNGLNHDGPAGDAVYGGQIPVFPAGTTVSYCVVATDSGGLITTDPPGAPQTLYTYTVTTNAQGVVYYDVLLGRPTDHSIAVSVLSSNNLEAYIAYGIQAGIYTSQTATNAIVAGTPAVITLEPLAAHQQYYYRLYYRVPGGGSFSAAPDRPFHTQRAPGDTFTFIIEADPHYLDNQPPLWQLALTNMLADNPDFLIDLGDTFMGEKYYSTNNYTLSQAGIYDACRTVRNQFFSIAGHSLPLFLVNGNHDPELGWLLNNSPPTNNSAVWGDQAREFYYPCPVPDAFFSGSTNADPYLSGGARDAYYAFEWGNALFVMLDNFWYSWPATTKSKDPWGWTLGYQQYQWLKRTLESSHAKFKFVFAHHLVGGSFDALARGGLANAPFFEWGGYHTNGVWEFDTRRPGWPMPIQSLLLSNGVNAFFHGHDHMFVKEDLDADGDGVTDLVYQECPQPSRTNYNAVGAAPGYGYTNYTALQGNSGYLRVQVTPTNAMADYVRVYLPGDENVSRSNRMVTYSYAFSALSITGTTHAPPAPTPTNSVWVTCRVSGSTNVKQVTLTYDAGGGPATMVMFDDGAHQDIGVGDGIFGGLIPAFPEGATVRYYVTANYDLSRVTVDPPKAPANPYAYTVVSPEPVTPFNGSIVLGRPTDRSITVSVLSSNAAQMYLEYGSAPGAYSHQTAVTNLLAGLPLEVLLSPLTNNSRYYYRLRYKRAGDPTYLRDTMHTFHTQRLPGSPFRFEIQGDSHPERATQWAANLYTNTLLLASADQPDFFMCIGDDFSVDTIPTNSINPDLVAQRYLLQRPYLGLVAHSASLFLVNGNHEQAAQYLLDGTSNNVAVWAGNARNLYYPMPAPDGFYSGDTEVVPLVGLLRDYYAWTWGDALFVTLDPYWHCPLPVDNVYGGAAKRTNWWDVTHGEAQYAWLKATLEQSQAKYKFVFAHHVLGSGRGGADEAPLYEWGGQNANGSWGFTANRPGWPMPIHQLMVANNVTAFIQGHDHIFVRQQLDGLTYLELPEPADPNYALNFPEAYNNSIYETNSTGRVRFSVSPDNVKIEYVRSYLPADEGPGKTNNMVDYSFVIYPLTVSGTTHTPAVPTAVDPVWVASTVIGGTNISQVTLTYIVGTSTNSVPMLDDGAHHDGAPADGLYGAAIPVYPMGTRLRYYVRAFDAATRQVTDPSGAPVNPNLFTYTVAPADTVGDGIPDGWRQQFFGAPGTTTNASSCATCDPDHDRVDNYHEYIGDTNPTNTLSYFRIQSVSNASAFAVFYPSSAYRKYTLYYRTNLTSGAWTSIPSQTDIPGSGGVDMLSDPSPVNAQRFYRVDVRLP